MKFQRQTNGCVQRLLLKVRLQFADIWQVFLILWHEINSFKIIWGFFFVFLIIVFFFNLRRIWIQNEKKTVSQTSRLWNAAVRAGSHEHWCYVAVWKCKRLSLHISTRNDGKKQKIKLILTFFLWFLFFLEWKSSLRRLSGKPRRNSFAISTELKKRIY